MGRQIFKLTRTKLIAGLLMVIATVAMQSRAQQNSSYKIAVLPFVDNTGSGGQDLATALSRAVQAEIAHSTQLQGRAITLDNGVNPNSVDANKAVQIGQSQNVDVVMLGTVLEATSQQSSKGINGPSIGGFHVGGSAQETKAVVTLQGDLYDVTTGKQIESIRVTGNASQKNVGSDVSTGLGDLSTGSNSFDNSAIGKAFHSAVSDMVKKISNDQSKMTHFAGGASSGVSASALPATSGPMAGGVSAMPAASSSAGSATSAAAPGAPAQPELKSTKIEFVPGEKTMFFEDFSDMAEDEPPPHWKVRNGTVELRTGGGIHELYADKDVQLTSPTFVIPVNFTLEVVWTGEGQMTWHLMNKDEQVMWAMVRGEADGQSANTSVAVESGPLGDGGIAADNSQPVKFALWAQQGRVRAYLNGQRVVDVNQVDFGPMDHIVLDFAGFRPNGLWQVRVAESAPDFSTVINASGKYVTHGINFDTDSDRLKPESAAVLKQVAAGLAKNPNLKLEIDGYTDSVGDAAHNVELSKRRAQAVQTVLVAQFGIDASRLTSNGFGAAKPTGSNDTPTGRAENRRVEFLKK